ncbi:MAG TPA: LysE family translocator [Acetobacteraceae bacterium]|nr:LysE family translocator [Acetobacteraceae bacterium]
MRAESLAWLASALAFAVAMAATPGPNNAMVTASGASWGFRRTLPHICGISIGFPVMLLAVALGAGEVLRSRPWVQESMRWVGAAYLLWLAWRIATAIPRTAAAGPDRAGMAREDARPLSFVHAALFQWVNPKAWVIALGAVVTFTTAGSGSVGQGALLAAVFLAVILPTTAFWTLVGVGAARVLRTPAALRRFNLAMAALLVASLVPLLLEG